MRPQRWCNLSLSEFELAWQTLSLIQKEAATWEEGPFLLLAGPGSGKTRVLTCRIARLLRESADSNFRILGLTFTNNAADEMRERVEKFVPGMSQRLFLGTFHSFCAEVLRQHGSHLGIASDFNIYSQDSDLNEVLRKAVDNLRRQGADLTVSDLDKKTLPVIQRLKSLLIAPGDCYDKFRDQELGERMALVYPAYEDELARRNALDFNSLIYKVHELFVRFPALAKRYRTVYPYICIDEFQDTNSAQYTLVRALTGDQHKNLFIVADDDQIIYQWNGASHKRFEQLLQDYVPDVLQLPVNYRCPPEVVSLANSLIQHNFLRSANKKPLVAASPTTSDDAVRLLDGFDDWQDEASGVARDIDSHHREHLGDVTILARSRQVAQVLEGALREHGLPVVLSQRKDEFESTPIMWLHSLLKLAAYKDDMRSLEVVCGAFKQLTGLDADPEDVILASQDSELGYLSHFIQIVRQSPHDAADHILKQISGKLLQQRDFRSFCRIAVEWFDQLEDGVESQNDPSEETFSLYKEERQVWDDLLGEISRSLGDGCTLEAFLQELQMHSKESLPRPGTVRVMTIHAAKGKEFDHVYLVGLVEDELPSYQSIKKGDDSPEMEEERRNCFVAITRTSKSLTLSYARRYRGWNKSPSRFLFEMGVLGD